MERISFARESTAIRTNYTDRSVLASGPVGFSRDAPFRRATPENRMEQAIQPAMQCSSANRPLRIARDAPKN